MTTGHFQDQARRWADELATSGPAATAASIRGAVAAAPDPQVAALVRALRYLHQVLLDAKSARELAAHLFSGAAPLPAPTPRQSALEAERRLLEAALAATPEPELTAAAAALARLEDEERALESERRDLEQLLEEAARG